MPVTAAQPSDVARASSPGDGHPTPAAAPAHATTGDSGGRPRPSSAATFGAFVEAGSPCIQIRAEKGGKSGEIEIYGDLDAYGFQKDRFVYAMRELKDAERILVRIDSGGGSPFDAFFIHDALRNHPAHVTTRVDGVAASGASVLMMAGDDREIVENGWVMIHNAWGTAKGGAEQFENYASVMRKMNDRMAKLYSRATGIAYETIVEMMDTETWMTGPESEAQGFATRILEPVKIAAKFDVSRFDNVPEAARTALGLETAMPDPKDTKVKNADGTDAAPADANTDQPNSAEAAVAEAATGFFAKLVESFKSQATSDAAPAKPTNADAAPDIEATVNAAVERQFAALLSADSPVVKGLGAAFTASITPIVEQLSALNTRVAAEDSAHRQFKIDSRLSELVTSGRLTPALAKETRTLLAAAGAALSDDAINAYLDGLAKSAPLNLATSAILTDPETGDVVDNVPAELNPPPGSGLVVKNTDELRITLAARAKAEAAGGTAEEKYKVFVAEAARLLGQNSGRTSLAFGDSAAASTN